MTNCPLPYTPKIPVIRWVKSDANRCWIGFVGTVMTFTISERGTKSNGNSILLYFIFEEARHFLADDSMAKAVADGLLKSWIISMYARTDCDE